MTDSVGVDVVIEHVARVIAEHQLASGSCDTGDERGIVTSWCECEGWTAPGSDEDHEEHVAHATLVALTEPRPCPTPECLGGRVAIGDWNVDPLGPAATFARRTYAVCITCAGSGVLPSFAVLRTDLEQVGWTNGTALWADDGSLPRTDLDPVFVVRASREAPE